MEMKDVLKKLREKNSLTQEQMAKRVMLPDRLSVVGKQERHNLIQIH